MCIAEAFLLPGLSETICLVKLESQSLFHSIRVSSDMEWVRNLQINASIHFVEMYSNKRYSNYMYLQTP